MFPKFKKLNNESGVVLFIVLMTVIIIMILSLGLLTQSMNETNYAQQQIDQYNCDELRKGVFWEWESSGVEPANSTYTPPNSGRTYTITTTPTAGVGGAPATWQISCTYDTLS